MTEKTSHWKGQEGHPSPEKLAAYFEGELSPEENDEIQEHLVDCDLCTQALLDLKAFLDFPEEGSLREGVADLGATAEWRDLHRKIEEERKPSQAPAAMTPPLRRFLVSPKTAYSLAAILAATVLGLSLYVQSLWHEQRASSLNVRAVFLPATSNVRSEPSVETLDLPRGKSPRITFTLGLPGGEPLPEYRVVIHRFDGEEIFNERGLTPQRDGIIFAVPSEKFREPGIYNLTLERAQGTSEPVGSYSLEIVRK